MPSDSNGVYTLPDGYLAVDGETIQPSQHNPPLEDIQAALTARLLRSGANPMTGPLKLADGSEAAPSLTFASSLSSGLYKSGSIIRTKNVAAAYVGEIRMMAHSTVPAGWLLCYGQAISRSTYSELFFYISTLYGAGDGSTTFNVPDLRGRVGAGRDNMGGVSANRLTNADDGVNGAAIASVGGVQTQTLVTANLPAYTPSGSVGVNDTRAWATSENVIKNVITGGTHAAPSVGTNWQANFTSAVTVTSGSITASFTGNAQGGSSQAFGTVQPTIIQDFMIFTGVAS